MPALFSPAYVGGRSAAEYWDLTEQVFNDITVLTSRLVRQKSQNRHGALFTLKHISQDKIFGIQTVWRHTTKVQVSDIHKTVIDMLDDATLGAGIQHVADCLRSYLKYTDRDDEKLIAYGDRLGNGAVFKRLGFLIEGNSSEKQLITQCRTRLTQGNAKLDPAITGDQRIITRWRLITPKSWVSNHPRFMETCQSL